MVGMDSHFYEQTSPLGSSFDLVSKASSQHSHHHHHRVPKCVSPALSHVTAGPAHGSEVIPTDLNTPELTFDHMSIQQFIRSNEINGTTNTNNNSNTNNNNTTNNNNHSQNHNHNHNTSTSTPNSSTNSSTGSGVSLEESVSIFSTLINVAAAEKSQLGSSNRHPLGSSGNHQHHNAASTVPQDQGLAPHSSHYTSSSYQPHPSQHHSQMPQQSQLGTNRYGLEASSSVKQEPLESEVDFSSNCSQNAMYTGPFASNYGNDSRVGNNRGEPNEPSAVLRHLPFSLGAVAAAASVSQARSSGNRSKNSSKKHVDKGSDEYKKRRERNNIAVRKSREKAKVRSRETEKKVSELARENDQLRKKVDSLCKELNVLKSLLTTVGVPPESVDSEIEKGLQMESHLQGGFGAM